MKTIIHGIEAHFIAWKEKNSNQCVPLGKSVYSVLGQKRGFAYGCFDLRLDSILGCLLQNDCEIAMCDSKKATQNGHQGHCVDS